MIYLFLILVLFNSLFDLLWTLLLFRLFPNLLIFQFRWLFSPFFGSFLPNILTFYFLYLKWVTYVRALLCVFTANAREESLEITVIRAYSCRRVISGEWWLLRTRNSGPRDRPLPSGLDSPEVWVGRAVIARAPPLVTSQYRGTTSEGSERASDVILCVATINDF